MTNKRGASAASPPDRTHRDLIRNELDRNVLVEAAAGTGKTTGMVERMLALLGSGKCPRARSMAAVTFTRKAAAELRARFQVELEKALREATGERRQNLERALSEEEQCLIGTIHSFCARLLRERPVEAGVGLDFEEIDEEADRRLRDEAWELFSAGLILDDAHELLSELHRLGLRLPDLKSAFMRFADFPDVQEWPLPPTELQPEQVEKAAVELEGYIAHMAELAHDLPEDPGNDTLIPQYKRLPRVASHYDDLRRPEQLMEMLELLDSNVHIVQKEWKKGHHLGAENARSEKARWERFREEVAKPNLRLWRELRYRMVMRLLFRARKVYDELRRERGALNFQDLLIKAAALLRENPSVRRYFQSRFSHLLVDEFQDTDPIQAEVILLLASSDPREKEWRNCVPRPGSLFVVGDPKQSIYRFRRADIVTYNEVKEIILHGDSAGKEGLLIKLTANFRATQPVIEWVNRVFRPADSESEDSQASMLRFPARACQESPSYVPLLKGREEGCPGELCGLYPLLVPEEYQSKESAVEYEAELIARTIRRALDLGVTVPRTRRQVEEGRGPEADPSDFMIITRNTTNLSVYARKLREHDIPHQVTGGGALNGVDELRLLHYCLQACLHPDNPVALLAALRSELFGISDASLYAFARSGGRFCYLADLPGGLSPEDAEAFEDAFMRLRTYAAWLSRMPPVAALEKMASHLGLPALAAAKRGGDMEAGSLYKGLELLRAAQDQLATAAQLAEYLGRLVEGEERHDGVSALSRKRPAVRVMNLHKAKGLEAPVVFLADPSGDSEHRPDIHIDRRGEKVRGYLAVYGKGSGNSQGKLLAHPSAWDILEEREREFLRAEELRLRYVAVTRSCAAIFITQKAKRNGNNPWRHFAAHLEGKAALPDTDDRAAPSVEKAGPSREEADETARPAVSRLRRLETPTYDAQPAKRYALSRLSGAKESGYAESLEGDVDAPSYGPEGEHGVEWGEVIHLLLHTAMENPQADLERLAAAAMDENGLDAGLAGEAVKTVRCVMSSEIWRRAQDSPRCLAEIPFQVALEEGAGLPTVLRGVIDLAFLEDDGWVLVDYKTDRPGVVSLGRLVRKYSSQINLYRKAWEKCTGDEVREAYLYFLEPGLLAKVD